jgi:hypothetical protein
MLRREEPQPLEGTRMDLFNSIIPNFFAEQGMVSGQYYGTADLANRVWVANRCQQLNAQQIAGMPLEWHGSGDEPQWVSNPDPNLFPNGIGDVLLNPSRVVQIDRNPTTAAHGTPALRAYAQNAWSLLAAGNQSMSVSQGGVPQTVLKSQRKLTAEQAAALQEQWVTAVSARNGAPPVLPPELDFVALSINPADLALLDTQQWNAMVLATAYGVPGPILNMALTGGLTYQNPIALMQMWWLTELRVTSKRVMDAWTARLLPRGQWVSQDATDMTIEGSIEANDDPQASNVSKVSPSQQPGRLTAIGGS